MAGLSQYPGGRAIIVNDWTNLLNKIERRLGMSVLMPHLPEQLNKDAWIQVIKEDSMDTFSRFFPNKIDIVINDESCFKKEDDEGIIWYTIKDQYLRNSKLLGIRDINWTNTSVQNFSLGSSNLAQYYYPSFNCPIGTFLDVATLQMSADMNSLYNRGIYIDFRYPNKFCLRGIGNNNYDLNSFVVTLLLQHENLSTISPTMMETFEKLAISDIASFLYQNLKYFDNLETAHISLDLKISQLEEWANKRDSIVEELDVAHVSASSDTTPYIFSV